MNEKDLLEMKNLILSKIQQIEGSVDYLDKATQPIAPSVSLGRLTRMEALNEKGVNEFVLSKHKQSLQKLYNALERIKNNSYGNCLQCKKEIPLGRLKIVPEAVLCVNCSSKK